MNVNCRHDQLIKQPYNQFEPFEPVLKHVTKMRDKSDYQMSCQKPYLGKTCHAGLCHTLKNVTNHRQCALYNPKIISLIF